MNVADQLRQLGLAGELPRTRPVYRHVVRALERGIAKGTLPPGLRLPAERELARSLHVSRTTIVVRLSRARDAGPGSRICRTRHVRVGGARRVRRPVRLAREGRRGRVAIERFGDSRSGPRHSIDPKLISLVRGHPGASTAFRPTRSGVRSTRSFSATGRRSGGTAPTEGQPVLREAIARRFGCQPDTVLVLAGAQQGLDLLARCLIDPGDTVVVDRPGYVGAIQTFRAAGARLVGWDVVRHDLDELEDHLLRYRPKLIYTNPTFHNPTGWTMPIRVRRDLLALATRLRVPIIEDDMYRGLHFTSTPPPPSLHSLDTQSVVIYLSGFSKVLAPGLRLGYLFAAKPIVEQLAHHQAARRPAYAEPRAAGRRGSARGRHVRPASGPASYRAPAPPRRAGLGAAAPWRGLPASLDDAGWRAVLSGAGSAGRLQASDVLARALDESVSFVRGETFYVDHAGERELRLCFTTVSPARAEEAGRRLSRALAAARREAAPPPQLVAVV